MDLPRFVSPREKLNIYSWAWRDEPDEMPVSSVPRSKFPPVSLTEENRNVLFHWGWSSGTAAVRGDHPFTSGQSYFWEIQICTAPYGTDVMVGVGTDKVNLFVAKEYVSLLGQDNESWGLSYTGRFHHSGRVLLDVGVVFKVGDVVGLHLDMWSSSLAFFVNGMQVCMVNDESLKKQALYPMMCSSSASTCLKLIYSYSCNSLLQKMCLESMKHNHQSMNILMKIPGLLRECEKLFVDTKDIIKETEEKQGHESEYKYIDPTELELVLESSEEEYNFNAPGQLSGQKSRLSSTTNQKLLKNLQNVDCVECGVNAKTRPTRSSASRLCLTCVDGNEIDIYAGI